jgi:hypothetical protein
LLVSYLGVVSVGGVDVSGDVESGRVVASGQPAGVLPAASGAHAASVLESGVDLVPGLVVELGLDVSPESARRMVPFDVPRSLSADRMLEQPVSAMPTAAASAIQFRCFMCHL